MIINLTQSLVDHNLQEYANHKRTELVSDERTGLYVEVRPNGKGVGTYYLRYKDNKGKSSHERLGRTNEITLTEARHRVALLKAEIEKGNSIDIQKASKKGDMLLNDFWVEYIAFAKSTKRSWLRDEQLYLIRIKPKFGHIKLSEITVKQIQTLMMDVRNEGLSGASADHHGQLMRRMGNLAVKWGYLDVNFANGIQLYHEFNQVENIPTDEEMTRLMHVLKTDENRNICLIILFLLCTSCRLNEALSAQWKNLSIEKRLLTVPMESSKSKRPRHIPLNDAAIDVINQISRKENLFVFTNPKTNKPYVNIFKPWDRLRKKAGLPTLRAHDLRHYGPTVLANAGHSLYEISQLLGHADTRVTQRYAHLSTETLLTTANSVSEKLSALMQPQLKVVNSDKAA
jgi:integrase